MLKIEDSMREEYGGSVRLMDEMSRLRRAWGTMVPPPPLKRSDVALLGAITEMAKRGEMVTVGKLAHALHQTPPAVSKKVSVLEAHGFIRRLPTKGDRRTARLELSRSGEEVARHAVRELLERIDQALEMLGPDKADRLFELVGELSAALERTDEENSQKGPHKKGKGEVETC